MTPAAPEEGAPRLLESQSQAASLGLVLRGIYQGYGSREVVRDLDLSLASGVVGLLGPNGAGKTTLLRTMATVMPPRAGTLSVAGVEIKGEASARRARRQIGYLPQSFGFDPSMRVEDFVRYGAWMRGVPSSEWDTAASTVLAQVDLSEQRRTKMKALSGGMRQRAGIAWAVIGKPAVVLLDEPTVGLDPRQRLHFRKIVSELTETVVVLSTHLIDDIDAICDQVVVINNGAPRFIGATRDLAVLGAESANGEVAGHSALERAYMHLLPEHEQQL